MNPISQTELEEGEKLTLDFTKIAKTLESCGPIIPIAVQNVETMEVILIAYTNQTAFDQTIQTGIATFWSTTRNELWIKGKTSGNTFKIIEILVNCEQNSLVYKVQANSEGICHTYNRAGIARNCYYRKLNTGDLTLENIDP